MNKEEFLNKLHKKLEILEESEITDILEEYAEFIDEKVSQGATEKEAVKTLGDIDELAEELLAAYKIKKTPSKNKNSFNNFVNRLMDVLERIIYTFSHKSFKEIVRFFIELVGILIIILLCKIPFIFIKYLAGELLENLILALGKYSLYTTISAVGNFFFEIIYLVFAIVLFVKIFECRYLNTDFFGKDDSYPDKKTPKNIASKKNQEQVRVNKPKDKESNHLGIIDLLVNIFVIFVKFIAFWFLLGVILFIIGITIALGISIYLLFKGVTYFGFYIGIIALLVLGICIFIFIFNFIFNRRSNMTALLITFLCSIIFLGIGIGIGTIEVANTSILYNDPQELTTKTFEYQFKDNLVFDSFRNNWEIDDSLKDKIKVEYKYNPTFIQYNFKDHNYTDENYEILDLYYDTKYSNLNNKIFKKLLADLKNKTIHIYDSNIEITVYVSRDTYDKLQKNNQDYEKLKNTSDFEDYDMFDVCEYLYNNGYSLPGYCDFYGRENM